jgi:hypothetical protein
MVLGAGGAAANGFCRSLRAAGGYHLIGLNTNPDDLHLAEVDEAVAVGTSDRELSEAIFQHAPDFVHAQPDEEVIRLSRNRVIARNKSFLPYHSTLRICQNKWRSYEAWEKAGLRVPRTWIISDRGDLDRAVTEERWLRRINGAGGAGAIKTGYKPFAAEWIERQNGWGEFTAAEILTGNSVTWMSLWWKGRRIMSQQRRRLSWANAKNSPTGVSGSTGISETCSDPIVESIAERAVLAIDQNAHGLFGVDMTYDQWGVPNPTEINAGRFFTTIDFFTKAGFNFPDWYVRLGTGYVDASEHGCPRNPLPEGLRWIRLMDKEPVLVA